MNALAWRPVSGAYCHHGDPNDFKAEVIVSKEGSRAAPPPAHPPRDAGPMRRECQHLRSRIERAAAAAADADAGPFDLPPYHRVEPFRREGDRREWPGRDALGFDVPAIT